MAYIKATMFTFYLDIVLLTLRVQEIIAVKATIDNLYFIMVL